MQSNWASYAHVGLEISSSWQQAQSEKAMSLIKAVLCLLC